MFSWMLVILFLDGPRTMFIDIMCTLLVKIDFKKLKTIYIILFNGMKYKIENFSQTKK